MSKCKSSCTRREDIQRLFDTYASGSVFLSVSGLLQFLHQQQMELAANEAQAEALIDLYEINKNGESMSFEGFLRFMESKDCSIFNQAHCQVYQDMNQPLTSYFISSSHNTYLTGDQLVGQSDLHAYVIALRKGCRCLEIDCWDGPELEPVVYHGHTLTTKILFKDVISTIEQHAFEVSAYPVILSLENHCCRRQQEVMAHYLVCILGDKLLKAPLNHPTTGDLPSPDVSQKVVAEALSDLVIYTRSVKFISFSYSRDNQNSYENTSLSEKKASKLVKSAGVDFVRHNQRFLSRIYPAGSRTDSSNYNPQKFWNVGAQLVALNFQSSDVAIDLNDGRFLDNGGCGYVLKPDVLIPFSLIVLSVHVSIPQVISGSNLPVTGGKAMDPFVKVKIYGVACDVGKGKTQIIRNNSLSPYWGTVMTFKITIPELSLVRFCVRDRTGLFSSEFVGQYTLPFLSMKKGNVNMSVVLALMCMLNYKT
uniref:Phosphoinositide phospholipase C n=1 Tax=Periophthalmus magnuspinnatus TaxID=409849 RepID=A0A3B3ZQK9_9GOBI